MRSQVVQLLSQLPQGHGVRIGNFHSTGAVVCNPCGLSHFVLFDESNDLCAVAEDVVILSTDEANEFPSEIADDVKALAFAQWPEFDGDGEVRGFLLLDGVDWDQLCKDYPHYDLAGFVAARVGPLLNDDEEECSSGERS